MITYAYQCRTCGASFERCMSIVEHAQLGQSSVRCDCGGVGDQIISGGNAVLLMQRLDEYKFDPRKNVRTYNGRDPKVEERHYANVVETQRQIVKARRAAGKEKDDWVFEGIAPAPLVDSINEREGDKNKVLMDPIPFLKATGTYMGPD